MVKQINKQHKERCPIGNKIIIEKGISANEILWVK